MSIVNRRNAVLGWGVWMALKSAGASKRKSKKESKNAEPTGTGTKRKVGGAAAGGLLAATGALVVWRKKKGSEPPPE